MIELIESTLQSLVPKERGGLYECAAYSLEGGKRLRPLLTLAIVKTYNGSIDQALQPACALELIHTYSLIHDDLPCMDDDDMRRNKPTLHKAYSESLAVLTGDFLLTFAFEILNQSATLSLEQKNALTLILAKKSGIQGMIGGQFLDITQSPSFIEMQSKKTAALITAALEFGGILSQVSDLSPLQLIGEHLGLAFQFVDDLIDNDGAVHLFGEEKTKILIDKHFSLAQDAIAELPNSAPVLLSLAQDMILRTVY